jgi:putative hydrolase of the HAD superfamily
MIRNIIFDYGGVIIDLDYSKPRDEFQQLGVTDFDEHFSQLRQSEFFDLLDTGKISERDFRDRLRTELGVALSDEQIDFAWNSMLIGVREEKIHLLTKLIASYKTYLLSNTNFIHLKAITRYLLRAHGRVNLDSLFDRVYYSCSVGLRKPDAAIYRKVMEDNSLKPSETLYIDDSLPNVTAAAAVGLIAAHYDPAESLELFIQRTLRQLNQPA